MKIIIKPEISKTICDFTGREITNQNYLGGNIVFDLMFFKSEMPNILREDAYETYCLEFDMSEKIALEVFNFLLKKYPKAVKKELANKSCYGKNVNNLKVVKSDWDKKN